MNRKVLLFLAVAILLINSGFVLLFVLPSPLHHPIPAQSQIVLEKSGRYLGGWRSPSGELLLVVGHEGETMMQIYNRGFDLISEYPITSRVHPLYVDHQWAISIGYYYLFGSSNVAMDNITIYRDLFIQRMNTSSSKVRLSLDLSRVGGVAPNAYLDFSYDGVKLVENTMFLPYFLEYSYNYEESTRERRWGMFIVDLVTQEVSSIKFQVDPKESSRAFVRGDNATEIILFLKEQENNIERNIVVSYRRDRNVLEEQSRQAFGSAWYGALLEDNQPVFISYVQYTNTRLTFTFNFEDRKTRATVYGSTPLSVGLVNQNYFASFAQIRSEDENSRSSYIEVINIHANDSVIRLPSNPLNYNSWFVHFLQGQGSQITYVVNDRGENQFIIVQQYLGFVYDLVAIRDQGWLIPVIGNLVMVLPAGILVYRLRFSQKDIGKELYPGDDSFNTQDH